MTFGVSRDQGAFEWAGTSLASVFAQRRNLWRPSMWRMLFDIVRFNQYALDLLADEDESEVDPVAKTDPPSRTKTQQTIGEYLDQHGYSEAFRNDYLIPMTASVWSTSPDKASLHFPAITLVRFLWNHHLLSTVAARPTWMTIPGGSRQYIDAVLAKSPSAQIHLGIHVHAISSNAGKMTLTHDRGMDTFDHVILACHGDTAHQLLAGQEECKVLSAFQTSPNTAILHSDRNLMPRCQTAWAAWNYMTRSTEKPQVCLTYWMNLLQHIPSSEYGDVFVTLNPLHRPREDLIQGEWTYHHPLYNSAAIQAQKSLASIQNTRGISYAGAWTKYGFHEDGFSSGIKVAMDHLGAKLPFDFVDSTFSRGRRPTLGWADHLVRFFVRMIDIPVQFTHLITERTTKKQQ